MANDIKENETKTKGISRKDALKLLPLGLLAGLSGSASAAVLNSETLKSDKKETIGFKYASADIPEYFYEFKVIMTIFSDRLFQETGYTLTAIKPSQNRVVLNLHDKKNQEIKLFILPSGIEPDVTPFYSGKYVDLLFGLGSKKNSGSSDAITEQIIKSKLLPTVSFLIDNYLETKSQKKLI